MSIQLSIIVCSYNRYDLIKKILSHFAVNQDPSPFFEMIVVENTPADLRQEFTLPDNIRSKKIICDQVGLSAARNAGLKAAEGELIAFLDDDALICKNWANSMSRAFDDSAILAVGGKVIPKFEIDTLPQWYYNDLAGYLSCIDWGSRARSLKEGEWIVGANMCFRRTVFENYGLFDTTLGRKGEGTLLSNEEIELINKIGLDRIKYSPEAFVEHIIANSRLSLKWFRRRVFWQAVSDALAGIQYGSFQELRAEYGKIAARFPAEHRNINMLNFEPSTPEQMRLQLRALYIHTTISSLGLGA